MVRQKRTLKPLADILKKALDQWNLTAPLKRHEVLEHWETIAGPKIASKSQPIKLQGDQLIVGVEHPTWIQELNFLKAHFIEKIQKLYPEARIKKIRFQLK